MINSPKWMVDLSRKSQARLRLFCFPYAGGGASAYRTWPALLPSAVAAYAIQYPGHEGRLAETPYTQLDVLIQELTSEIYPYLDIPFVFFGHSLGALVSFELARSLRKNYACLPQFLAVSARSAPQLAFPHAPIYGLPDAEFAQELQRFEGTPEAILQNPDLRELFFPILRADMQMSDTSLYSPEAPLSCPIVAFGGLQDKSVAQEQIAAWEHQTRSRFALHMFPGGHFYLHTGSEMLLERLSEELAVLLT